MLPEDAIDRDWLLTDVSLYWFMRTAGPSGQLYYETNHDTAAWGAKTRGVTATGVAVFLSHDISIRRLAEREHNIVRGRSSTAAVTFRPWRPRSFRSVMCAPSSDGSDEHIPGSHHQAPTGRP
jgi:hypothetical protein